MAKKPPTIQIVARGLCVTGSRVLLCRNVKGEYYYLPGGHVEFGEPADLALAREFMEETGIHTQIGELMLVTEHSFLRERPGKKSKPHHELNMVFHVEHLELPEGHAVDWDRGGAGGGGPTGPDGKAPPPPETDSPVEACTPIESLEKKIAFDWVDLAAVPDLDIRPPEIKAWLAADGQTDPNETQSPIGWVSNCDPRILPESCGGVDED
ncbi:MAG: ADP-ribose pyrophosphatase YjhB (NUDIX family) [Phycisphaerales bacterium]|jgi:ADP-ribose pyrophosphatase YjhB (NUDIX family)